VKIDLPDDFAENLKEFMRGCNVRRLTIEAFVEGIVRAFMESWPWDAGDICVHRDECMHYKGVEAWREEHK
jgi:hypothetical protein